MPDYIKILLLLSDTYEASKLLTVADSTLRDILKLFPDNKDAWFRLIRVQRVLGDKDAETSLHLQDKTDWLKNSRLITVEGFQQKNPVYLLDEKQIQISIDPSLRNRLAGKKIIQVFADQKIAYEEYVDKIPEVITLDVKEAEEFQKVDVEVKFL
jgi:hypothetical protein